MNTTEHYLTAKEERTLLRIARAALESHVLHSGRIDLESFPLTGALRERHGAFVTLHRAGQLRGCIGYTANTYPLAQTVAENAVNAASRDPRFPAVTSAELADIHIEISALTPGETPETPFKRVHDIGEIVIGRDGLYIEKGVGRGGILLPQVAVEYGWNVSQFLAAVCRKAGYHESAWKDADARLYRFSAQVFSESSVQGDA